MPDESTSLLDRLIAAWRDIASSSEPRLRVDLSGDGDVRRLREDMQDSLAARGGEVSARARAAQLGRSYLALNETGKARFLRILAGDFDVDRSELDAAMKRVLNSPPRERPEAEAKLRGVLEPPRVRLMTQFNDLPEGVKFLVDLRADLIPLAKKDASLAALDDDLRRLLAAWFDVGFLELTRIDWNSSASLLEKLIEYEAVHAIRSWDDMKNRLAPDRRCFAFVHPRMPQEPLIFVEVALVNGLADNVINLLDESAPEVDPHQADTAIFYSINNAQRGLIGISFGGFLIKRVVDALAAELPNVKTFSTLSPIPGFRRWLAPMLADDTEPLLASDEYEALAALTQEKGGNAPLRAALSDASWIHDERYVTALRGPLMRHCARYLLREKNRAGRAKDPVGNFHLTNGARVERINWLGDTSAHGLDQSYGMMVNYLYRLDKIADYHEQYSATGKVVASSAVNRLLKN